MDNSATFLSVAVKFLKAYFFKIVPDKFCFISKSPQDLIFHRVLRLWVGTWDHLICTPKFIVTQKTVTGGNKTLYMRYQQQSQTGEYVQHVTATRMCMCTMYEFVQVFSHNFLYKLLLPKTEQTSPEYYNFTMYGS